MYNKIFNFLSIEPKLEIIGFEPIAFCMQNKYSSKLSYIPDKKTFLF